MNVYEDYYTAAAAGNIRGVHTVNKFGCATDCDSGIRTDVWDGADGSTSTDIWVPPTQARVHNLVSTDAADASAGTGARTVQVYGLKTWEDAESSEIVTLDGLTPVATANSYVIIHRMKCLTFGSGEINAGTITATAVTDATITAAISLQGGVGNGQTQMCIYGVPHKQELRIYQEICEIFGGGGSPTGTVRLLVKENADQSDAGFVLKDQGEVRTGQPVKRNWIFPLRFAGPCIAKVQIETNTNNVLTVANLGMSVATNSFKDDY